MPAAKPPRPEFDERLLDRGFAPAAIEASLYAWWEASGFFAAGDADHVGEPYCIMIPPPNVTGTLHMGHAFQHTLMDTLIRHARMQGKRTLWQMGTDHAGIATQMVVERQLAQENLDKATLGRDEFVRRVWQWRAQSGGEICQQLRRMGSSLDWSRECFTMDTEYAGAVREAFVRCHEAGYVYRGKKLVNWDPVLHTAISDLEVENREESGSLVHIRYPLADHPGEFVTVATTRPETLLGDTAVAVHPEDARFSHLVGKRVRVPIVNREVPIIGDRHVSMEFGTGCLKVTPAHDFNDYDIGKRHGLPEINILDKSARLNDQVPAELRGLQRTDARKRVVEILEQQKLLAGRQDHVVQIPRGDRSGAVIEPLLTDQWFMRMDSLRDLAVDAVASGRVEFVPGHYANLFNAWMRDIRDWCISRQLWWGHRIPAWYDEAGNIHVGRDEAEVRQKYGLGDLALRQETDVLETWFSSSLWSFATLGWPTDTEHLECFHPTSVLVTGHDIIFFWVARMMMMSLGLLEQTPFHQVYIHGLVRDAQGQKMSKSRGNGLDPLDLVDGIKLDALLAKRTSHLMQPQLAPAIERATRRDFPDGIAAHGVDAVRFTFAALASTGRDVRFDLQRVEGYRHFCNKLWNAARFVLMNTGNIDAQHGADGNASATGTKRTAGLAERWIRSRLAWRIRDWQRALEARRFDLLAESLYEFVWHEYCDWYLEAAKPDLHTTQGDSQHSPTLTCLLEVLEVLLRALHPLMPFITEALWYPVATRLGIKGDSIMLQPYPCAEEGDRDTQAESDFDWMRHLIGFVRKLRSERGLPPNTPVDVLMQGSECSMRQARARLAVSETMLRHLGRIDSLGFLVKGESAPACAFEFIDELKVMVPLAGVVDIDLERTRLEQAIHKNRAELARVLSKLDNSGFVERAPEEVVSGEREKRQALETRAQKLAEARASLG